MQVMLMGILKGLEFRDNIFPVFFSLLFFFFSFFFFSKCPYDGNVIGQFIFFSH